MSRSPFATTSTVAASWWPSATSAEQKEPSPAGDQPVAAADASVAAESAAVDETVAETADAATLTDTAPVESEPAAVESSTERAAPEPEPLPEWPAFPSYGSVGSEPASAWPSLSPSTDDTATRKSDDLAEAVEAMADEGAGSDELAEAQPEEAGEEPVATEPEQPSWYAQSDADDYDAPPVFAAPPPTPAPGGSDDTLSRARALLDELGALLPTLAAPAAPAVPTATDTSEIAAGLAAARDEASAQQSQLDALMAVVETARARPRDIDVMLDLSRHVEAIVSLKDGYERYREAVDAALGQLQSE